MAEQWMEYIQQVVDKMDFNTGAYTETGVCEAAAIYGLDGQPWAWSPNFPELTSYTFQMEGMGETIPVEVDEVQCAIKAGAGNRKPCEAGVRMGNEKYMFVTHDPDTKVTQLSKSGGGCAIGTTGTAVIIAFYVKDKAKTSGNGCQTMGQCAEQVQVMTQYLIDSGF